MKSFADLKCEIQEKLTAIANVQAAQIPLFARLVVLERKLKFVLDAEERVTDAEVEKTRAETRLQQARDRHVIRAETRREITFAENALKAAIEDLEIAKAELELEKHGFRVKFVPGEFDRVAAQFAQTERTLESLVAELTVLTEEARKADLAERTERCCAKLFGDWQEADRLRTEAQANLAEKGRRAKEIADRHAAEERRRKADERARMLQAETTRRGLVKAGGDNPLFRKLANAPAKPKAKPSAPPPVPQPTPVVVPEPVVEAAPVPVPKKPEPVRNALLDMFARALGGKSVEVRGKTIVTAAPAAAK